MDEKEKTDAEIYAELKAECEQYKKEIESAEKKFPDVKAILGDFPDPELEWKRKGMLM